MSDAIANFVSVMTKGARRIGGSASEPDKLEARTYVRDITPDLQSLLQINSDRQDVQDWWSNVLGHLPRCEIEVKVEAGSKTWAKVDANEVLENKFGMSTHERVQKGLQPLAASVKRILVMAEHDLPPLSEAPSEKVKASIDKIW